MTEERPTFRRQFFGVVYLIIFTACCNVVVNIFHHDSSAWDIGRLFLTFLGGLSYGVVMVVGSFAVFLPLLWLSRYLRRRRERRAGPSGANDQKL